MLKATIVVEWSIGFDTCILPYTESLNCTEVNIFFDINLSPSDPRHDVSPYNNNIPTDPIFIWNATFLQSEANYYNYDSPIYLHTFRTELTLSTSNTPCGMNLLYPYGSLVYYPFDCYNMEIFAFAQETSTNKSVSLEMSVISVLAIGLDVTTLVRENVTDYWPFFEYIGSGKELTNVKVILQWSPLVIAYCLIITFTFWLVTLMICLIMIATVFFGFRQRNEIVVVPIGIVFAFTQLRSSMPGAPEGFGDILDFVGLLPCLVLLSISAIMMVGIYLFTDPDDPSRRKFTWSELGMFFINTSTE
ncbi:uncharacterized protein EV420DRAFT_1645832 [Desarmillaria tabescens]|uniref:Uncharacterized protein n=1 Tax=Armillaria tabescens TaxID=1929756 RepID=A0AA39MZV1_ARMTA|nr:uncharacterized protein EV420DRAFT_1645832 [Desarmillaria tabescens]KAK0452194.1 hypothetical protein EV420DRAFT_1645832 [Desarmillaria tabescens]